MKREQCKFFSGVFAGLAWTHGAYAVATSTGIVDEPVFMGRSWGIGYMWTEAVVYSAISLALGYAGWNTKSQEQLQTSTLGAGDGHKAPTIGPPGQPISH